MSSNHIFTPPRVNCKIFPTEVKFRLVTKVHHCAILDANGRAVPCGEQRHRTWYFRRGGDKRSLIRRNLIGNFLIETRFNGSLYLQEGEEPNFWEVRLSRPPIPGGLGDSFLSAVEQTVNSLISKQPETISETLREALKSDSPIQHQLSFSTREDSLAYHRILKNAVWDRHKLAIPEKTQVLLAELGAWCAEKRGRQTQIARRIRTTPQTVNDWLNGRKKMTGEQALRINELMGQARRGRKL
jgi:hypothetical protein